MYKLMVELLYGSGLRIKECCRLRVKDLDLERLQLGVRSGKGDQDRVTVLPRRLVDRLRGQVERVRRLHEDDLTTMIYLHVMEGGTTDVRSPLDLLDEEATREPKPLGP